MHAFNIAINTLPSGCVYYTSGDSFIYAVHWHVCCINKNFQILNMQSTAKKVREIYLWPFIYSLVNSLDA